MDTKRKKELKLEYKQTPTQMGVYQIRNKINGKIFVGSSMDLRAKKNSEIAKLSAGIHPSPTLQVDWNSSGPDTFEFYILEAIKPETISPDDWRKEVTRLEDKWLDTLQPYEQQGYNKLKS